MKDIHLENGRTETGTPRAPEALPVLTRYHQEFFRERLRHVIDGASYYEQTLSNLWESQLESNGHASGYTLNDNQSASVANGNAPLPPRQLRELITTIKNAGIETIVLETAHVYLYESLHDESLYRSLERQFHEANRLTSLLNAERIRIRRVLFIDDYNPDPRTGRCDENLDVDEYCDLAAENGFAPDYLIWESDMAPIAKRMTDFMRDYQSLVAEKQEQDDAKLVLAHRSVELLSQRTGKISCSALDAALSLLKLRYIGDGIVNVLPRRRNGSEFSFRGQQKKVRHILMDHLGVRVMPFFNLFTPAESEEDSTSGFHHALRKRPR